MKPVLKHIVAHTYKPLLVKYLAKTRTYRHNGIHLIIPPEVFHPGFFFSTGFLLGAVKKIPLRDKKFLELGAGSGLISIYAAGKGAKVTATDINPVAIEYLHKNSEKNNANFEIILSDLFKSITVQKFDVIAVNPPYYKKQPKSWIDHAWLCGENGEFFTGFFARLGDYIHKNSDVLMVLCDDCDMKMIKTAAAGNGFQMKCIESKQNLLEKNFIFSIDKIK